MHQLSSNSTLLFKIFIPTFWIVFFGAFTVSVFVMDVAYFGNIPAFLFRIGVVTFLLLGMAILAWAFLRLKRVDADEHFFYVSNYFKSVRYPLHQIDRVEERDFGLVKSLRCYLKAPGVFGSQFTFLVSRKRLQRYLDAFPQQNQFFPASETESTSPSA